MASNFNTNPSTNNIPMNASIPRPGSQSGSYVPRSLQQPGSYGTGGNGMAQMGGMSYTPQKPMQGINNNNNNPKPQANMAYSMQNGGSNIHNVGQYNGGGQPASFRGNDSPRLSFNTKPLPHDQLQSSTFSLQPIHGNGNGSSGLGNALNNNNNNNQLLNSTPNHNSQHFSSQFFTTGSIRGGRESMNGAGLSQSMANFGQNQQQKPYPSQYPNLQQSQSNATFNGSQSTNWSPNQSMAGGGRGSIVQQPQQQETTPQQPVIIPVQRELNITDPLAATNEPALASRKLMRGHYKATGLCVLFVFVLFLLLSPITYWIASSRFQDERKNYTKEECVVSEVKREEYKVPTACGESIGYRFHIDVTFDAKPFPLCSAEPYACYNATAVPAEFGLDLLWEGNDHQITIPTTLSQLHQQSLHPLSRQSPLQSPIDMMGVLGKDPEPFSCTLCLRNSVDQCFSPISTDPSAYDHLVTGTKIPCWEYTRADEEVKLLTNKGSSSSPSSSSSQLTDLRLQYRYFMGNPTELDGYPYIHSWYIFFIVGTAAFLLIAIYYIVKGVGVCDIIDPSYWQRKKAAKEKEEQKAAGMMGVGGGINHKSGQNGQNLGQNGQVATNLVNSNYTDRNSTLESSLLNTNDSQGRSSRSSRGKRSQKDEQNGQLLGQNGQNGQNSSDSTNAFADALQNGSDGTDLGSLSVNNGVQGGYEAPRI